jgi:hypothetical protein
METQFGSHLFLNIIRDHWVSAFFVLLSLTTILVLVAVRWWLKRRWQRLLQERFEEEEELDVLTPLGSEDQQALEVIKQYRQEVWALSEADLQLNFEALNQRAVRVIRSIAAVYHPEVEIAQYEASLVEILHLIRRVSAKLARLGGVMPFRFLGNRKLSDYQRYYEVYKKINENPILQALKRNPHLYKAARLAMNVKNLGNPLYWAGKELSREGYFYVMRWFYLTFISQVGREAMRLYSGRHFQTEEDRDATLIGYRLFNLARHWGGPSAGEWAFIVDFITNHPSLEAEVKVHILSRCSQDKLPKDLDQQTLQSKSGVKWYQQGLKGMLEKDPHPASAKAELIKKEMMKGQETALQIRNGKNGG